MDRSYSSGQKRLQIGYETSSDRFIWLIDICFNDINYSTNYIHGTLVKGIQRRQVFNMTAVLTELITTTALLIHQICFILVQINKEQSGNLVPRALINTLNVLTT